MLTFLPAIIPQLLCWLHFTLMSVFWTTHNKVIIKSLPPACFSALCAVWLFIKFLFPARGGRAGNEVQCCGHNAKAGVLPQGKGKKENRKWVSTSLYQFHAVNNRQITTPAPFLMFNYNKKKKKNNGKRNSISVFIVYGRVSVQVHVTGTGERWKTRNTGDLNYWRN